MRVIQDVLSDHSFFYSMDAEIISKLSQCCERRSFASGEYIFRQGENADTFYLIECGKVEIELFSATGGPVVVQSLQAGELLG